jgi:DNA-binding MarR family transcriptional regulator
MSFIVAPYRGGGAARIELRKPTPQPARSVQAVAATNPLGGLDMRLTYRTMLVLTVIAEHPGASNREVAEDSGIVDQGQISKLLGRLARLDLVENFGDGQSRGAANAWRLTARGKQLERAIRPR